MSDEQTSASTTNQARAIDTKEARLSVEVSGWDGV